MKTRMDWLDWAVFLVLVLPVIILNGYLGCLSMAGGAATTYRDFRAITQWFDPVFFQYNLVLATLAVLIVPLVTLSYVLTMAERKTSRLRREIPEELSDDIPERIKRRCSFKSYWGSVGLTTIIVLVGSSIILLFKPSPSADLPGVNFGLGANMLMSGPFFELFTRNPEQYYINLTNSLTAFQFGFLGAYIYFIGALARAFFTLDLTPQTFMDGSIRMIVASVLALVISFGLGFIPGLNPSEIVTADSMPSGSSPVVKKVDVSTKAVEAPATPAGKGTALHLPKGWGLLPIVSFFFGFYPRSALLAIQRTALNAIRGKSPDTYRALPLSMLPGMSYSHELRLEREGVDNIENMSHINPVDFAIRTGFGYAQLRQWQSAAWLAAHLREDYYDTVRLTGITSGEELGKVFATGEDALNYLAADAEKLLLKLRTLDTITPTA